MEVKEKIRQTTSVAMRKALSFMMPDDGDGMLSHETFATLYERNRLAPFFPYGHVDEQCIWMNDNPNGADRLLFGYEIVPFIEAGNEGEDLLKKLYSQLPDGMIIYSVMHADPSVHEYMERWFLSQRGSANELLEETAYRRTQFVMDWANKKTRRIGRRFAPRSIRNFLFFKMPPHISDQSREAFEAVYREFEHVRLDTIEPALHKMSPRMLTGQELGKHIVRFANPQVDGRDFRDYSLKGDGNIGKAIGLKQKLSVDRKGVITHEDVQTGRKAYSLCHTVTGFQTSHAYRLKDISEALGGTSEADNFVPGELYAYSIIECLDRKRVMATLRKKVVTDTWSRKFEGEYTKDLFSDSKKQKQQNKLLHDRIEAGERPVRVITGVIATSTDREELRAASKQLETNFTDHKMELFVEDNIAIPIWMASMPGIFRREMDGLDTGLCRCTTMTALNAACLSHIEGSWYGCSPDGGGALTFSRLANAICLNLYNSENYNFFVSATSGSGKSFFVNELARWVVTAGGVVRIIDAGKSYKNVAEIIGGVNIEFTEKNPICLNPFSSVYTEEDLKDQLSSLVCFVMMIAFEQEYTDSKSDSGKAQIKERGTEEALVHECIDSVWDRLGANMSLEDIYHALREDESIVENEDQKKMAHDIAFRIKKWAVGKFKRWFVGQSTITFDNPFIILELDGLDNNPLLKELVLYLLLQKLGDETYAMGKTDDNGNVIPKLTIIDEAWALMKKPATAAMMETAVRRYRKYGAILGIVSQSYKDALKTSSGCALLDNSDWMIAMKQPVSGIQSLIKDNILDISERQKNLVGSISNWKGDYSEFLVMNKNGSDALCRFVVDPFSYALFTTKPDERTKIEYLIKEKGYSRLEAVQALADKLVPDEMFTD